MIEPGKNGHRSGSVAKGRCEAGCFAKNGRPLVRWILTDLNRAKHPRGRHLREPAAGTADEVAAHLRERSGEPAQTHLARRGWRSDEGQRCRAVQALRKPVRRTISPAPMSLGTGTGSGLGWINLTTCDSLRCFASTLGRAALHPSVTRRAISYESHPSRVSIQPGAESSGGRPTPHVRELPGSEPSARFAPGVSPRMPRKTVRRCPPGMC